MTMRRLLQADLEQVLAIEEQVHASPWSKETFEACFEAGFDGWVLEVGQKIAGFILVSFRNSECHILNVCIASTYQHQGLGRKLMEEALTYARRQGTGIAYLEVRRSNVSAIKLYEHFRFLQVGERKGYYPATNGTEDALIFAKSLIKSD